MPTARPLAVEVIAGPGKDAQREGREGQRKQGTRTVTQCRLFLVSD